MSDAIENATIAFDQDMGAARPAPSGGMSERVTAPEAIFGNSDTHEGDVPAGGDNTPAPGEKVRKPKPAPAETDEEEFYDPLAEESDEGDAEDDTEEGADEGEDDEDKDDEDELLAKEFTVMVDGQEEVVPLKEALDGYIRTKTFHKRMNQLDSVKKELGNHAQKIIDDRAAADQRLAEAEEILTGLLPDEPDWDKLFAEDPKAARDLQKQYDNYRSKIDEIKNKRTETSRAQAERESRERIEYAQAEFPKFAANARWRNKEDMTKDIASMRKSALSVGFSEEEVAQVLDHRMLTVLLKASKFDRMMAAKPKAVKTGKTPVNPGAGSNSTARRGVIGAQNKLARTGSVDDAASVFAKIISR